MSQSTTLPIAAGIRPEPSCPAPPGSRWEAAAAAEWRAEAGDHQCRTSGGRPRVVCRAPTVAAVDRSGRSRPKWRAYCTAHLPGEVWVAGGRVMAWRLVWVVEIPGRVAPPIQP